MKRSGSKVDLNDQNDMIRKMLQVTEDEMKTLKDSTRFRLFCLASSMNTILNNKLIHKDVFNGSRVDLVD